MPYRFIHIWAGLAVGCCGKDRFCFPHSCVRAGNPVDGHLNLLENWTRKGERGRSEGFLLDQWAKLVYPSAPGYWEGLGFGRCSQEWGGSSYQGDWASYSAMDEGERDISRDADGLRLVSSPSGAISFSSLHCRDNLVFWGFCFALLTHVSQASLGEFGPLAPTPAAFQTMLCSEACWGKLRERRMGQLFPDSIKQQSLKHLPLYYFFN